MNARKFFSVAALVATLAVPGLASAHGFDRGGERDGRPVAVQMHDRRDEGRGMERQYQAPVQYQARQYQMPVRQDGGRWNGGQREMGRQDGGRVDHGQDHGRFARVRSWFGR